MESTFTLNSDQAELVEKLKKWWDNYWRSYDSEQKFVYSGAAGTGKTTVMSTFINEIGLTEREYVCAALIGKAVLVMLKKGLPAKTVHSLIYNYMADKYIDENGEEKREFRFQLKNNLPKNLQLLVIDESSFITDKIAKDILSFGLPVIFTGDMNQLPPPFGNSTILENPDHVLRTLMRQKEDDMIVQFAANMLCGRRIPFGEYGNCRMLDSLEMGKNLLYDYDCIICSRNKTRELINQYIRSEILGIRKPHIPAINEKVICRENKWTILLGEFSLTNGTVGYVKDIMPPRYRQKNKFTYFDFQPDYLEEGQRFREIPLDLEYLNLPVKERKNYSRFNKSIKFEYAYAITAYISQGSEYDRVLFIDEPCFDTETRFKLRYTAATRAVKRLDVLDYNGILYNKDLINFNKIAKIM